METSWRDRLQGLSATATIKHENFAGLDLVSLEPGNYGFDRCDFCAADLRLATLDRRHFFFCDFSRTDLTGASMRGATFAGCNFTDANLTNCDLTGSTLTYVNTGGSNGVTVMTGARLKGARLNGVVAERVVGWHQQ
ncbi:pentapeptide repeat-containing protein [Aeromicrobium endophyticum]|uniref:Pentapeptide repeat-containing protein n=1 Tax=Aeromicrobium endophyticum TaxID=2292704 RepID=A0A371P8G1_9ACTN|nr:pentapeptide repeat-containing protein [Aeromicrobium endophyticum]REK72209.1 pentapeptide repeat-containing protein [Aeromicrobium endophyticum]